MNPMQSKKSVPFSVKEKAVGRGMAKVAQQKAGAKVPMAQGHPGGGKPYGGGVIRGTTGASSGKKWVGVR